MPVPKTLLPLGGKTLVEYAVDHVLGARVEPVVVVLGHAAEELKGVLAGRPVGFAVNPRYREGQAGSLREGLLALPHGVAGVVCCLGDQPLIPASVVDALVERFLATGAPVVYPSFKSQRGNPVLFSTDLLPELLELTGDEGGRAVIAQHAGEVQVVATGVPGVVQDVDTWDEYTRLREQVEAGDIPWLVE
ncbi:hypothetical protein SY88_04780 [Clostridiales bacterium PH28_bin88]|nr:hypothetical protein SY88_04780 [Clostridiales bacterium PH28_bin88]